MKKKGQVSDQFNWIFAAVAGGIILLMFLFVIGQMKASGDAKLGVTILEQMDAVLTGSESTDNAVTPIPINDLFSMTLTCDEDSVLQIDNTASSLDVKSRFLYTPTTVGSSELLIATKELYRPFYLGNAVLLSDEDMMFFVFAPSGSEENEQSLLESVFAELPNNISKSHQGYFLEVFSKYKHLVIISTVPPPSLQSAEVYNGVNVLKDIDASWIEISIGDLTTATIYTKTKRDAQFDSGETVKVPEIEMLSLLAHSKDSIFYNCAYDKLNAKLKIVTKIYKERITSLSESDVSSDCRSRYLSAIPLLDDLENSNDPYMEQDIISQIKTINQNLLLLSCPVIY